jgi:GNAT superfamily N-acetyltransferase
MPTITPVAGVSAAACEAVLRSLPRWFGVEAALREYVEDTQRLPTFGVHAGQDLIGFVTLRPHFTPSWEVHCLAVHADRRGQGLGTQLIQQAETWAAAQGALLMQVKTIADSHPSPAYAQTRAFYAARGYLPLEVFPTLWSPQHPVLQLVKVLPAALSSPPSAAAAQRR